MSGGILEQFNLVKRARDDLAFQNNDRANRRLLRLVCSGRLPQSLAHEVIVALQVNDWRVHA